MCGIFGIINYNKSEKINKSDKLELLKKSFNKGIHRGPEFSTLISYTNQRTNNYLWLGFHRLAINGLNTKSNQPFEIADIVLVCNGEIYNYKQLATENNITLETESDCEIIIHLYKIYGIEYTLTLLDGVFSFILYDKINSVTIVGRDPYGVRPLYYFNENDSIGFSSELKVLYDLVEQKNNIHNFTPGNYMIIYNNSQLSYHYTKYTNFPCINKYYNYTESSELYIDIINHIKSAVNKRVVGTTERPIGCLLSGGLDSSLIAALVNDEYKKSFPNNKLDTFSIGLYGSEDLKYASIVSKHLNTNHHEIIVSEDDFFNAIPEVIKNIESYDTTTVRASVGNYLLGKYIKENTDCKVIFNGDGADELMGGYLYMKKAPNKYEFDRESRRLLQDIYMFDVLRSDKSISSHGLEPRTPFLDRQWVEFYLSIDRKIRYESTLHICEKYLIRKSFDTIMPDLLPKEILWRTKEAFSDGVSSLNRSWYIIIQEKIDNLINNESHKDLKVQLKETVELYKNMRYPINKPTTVEQIYYRTIYNLYYLNTDHLINYFWMPKYVNANDASARTLDVYRE